MDNGIYVENGGVATALKEKNGTTERRLVLNSNGTLNFCVDEGSGWVVTSTLYRVTDLTAITLNTRVKYCRIGNVCTVVVDDTTTGVTNGTLLGTLPALYRPILTVMSLAYGGTGVRVCIDTNGNIYAYGPSGTFLINFATLTFVCK